MSPHQPEPTGGWASPDQTVSRPGLDDVTTWLPAVQPASLPPVPLPRREGARPTVMVLAATAVALLFLGGLGWWISERNAGPVARSPGAGAVVTSPPQGVIRPTGPPVYALATDLCEAADFTRLRPTFNQIGDLHPVPAGYTGSGQSIQCDGSTGNEQVRGTFSFWASVYPDAVSAVTDFQADRDKLESYRNVMTSTIDSTGQSAYRYSDSAGKYGVEIYDGNLRIRMSWVNADGGEKVPVDPFAPMVQTCESTMTLLRPN